MGVFLSKKADLVMTKPKILIQLDVDAQASVFDAVVAVDAGVDHLLRHQGVEPRHVRDLVHGAMFTRGAEDLRCTALFVGGSDVTAAEAVLDKIVTCFFGPTRVSVLFDANGANTTAAAAVLKAAQHVPLDGSTATVLGATGPVGQRAVQLLARAGASVRVASRRQERAEEVCQRVGKRYPKANLTPCATASSSDAAQALHGSQIAIAAGAAGIELVDEGVWSQMTTVQVAIDLNAVPPAGIAHVKPNDAGVPRDGKMCYGAIGVGGLKMKIHKAAIRALFTANDKVLDAEEIFELGQQLLATSTRHD